MDEVTQHPDLLPRMGFRRLLGGADRLEDTVAIPPRRDLEDVHRFESTRPFRARTERSGYEKVTGWGPPAHASRALVRRERLRRSSGRRPFRCWRRRRGLGAGNRLAGLR